ncbi:MAG: hypothetical protein HOO98_15020 [Nitrospira sp.]|nr:hypothetical protein [Nitrospira sp.]
MLLSIANVFKLTQLVMLVVSYRFQRLKIEYGQRRDVKAVFLQSTDNAASVWGQ